MSTTFTKLFSSITESTIWCESAHTRLVWITMLAMADRKGRVWASIPGLANRARVPLEDTITAIDLFLSPDKFSRTGTDEGRRIEVIDGGWQLINYAKYREMRDAEDRREYQRKWDRDNRNPTNSDKSDKIRPATTKAEEEAEAELSLSPNGDSVACPHQKIIAAYHTILPSLPVVRVWTEARKKLLAARWREEKERRSIDFWRRFFMYVGTSDFLMGRTNKFEASLPWLLKAENFAKVIEGNYDNRNKP